MASQPRSGFDARRGKRLREMAGEEVRGRVEYPEGGVGDGSEAKTDAGEVAGDVTVVRSGIPRASRALAEVGAGRPRGERGERTTGCRLRS